MSSIKVENLCCTYGAKTPFERHAVKDVSFEIQKGDFVGLIGHTGSGKSTLVSMLNGLIKPSSGKVYVDSVDIWQKPKEIRKFRFKVGLVFQYPEYQLFEETVEKDIAFGPSNMGLSEEEINKRVLNAAKFVGLTDEMLKKSPFDLSGGEKRRAAIAGVIAMDPDVLILDEPTAGLDPVGRNVLLSQISQYQKARNNTVILVSHSMEDVARVCNKVMVMNKGEMFMFDKTQEIFARADELNSIGLRVPQITRVTDRLREMGLDLPKGILTVDKAVLEITELLKKEGRL
ncbi:MAG: energy-coupling factor transporter ATPase [Ruminococcus sp.]|nr:energy-coupling factor transporter ATPase [Ruminococcus sp.]